ncbi:extracellular calcium-sensing receptor-like [Discoglossus pictus]
MQVLSPQHPGFKSIKATKMSRSTWMFYFESFRQLQALLFAVEEINSNHNILPNLTLGLQVYDSCSFLQHDLEGTLQDLTGWDYAIINYRCLGDIPLAAIIGHTVSTHSILLAHILGLYRYPQISHFSTSHLLSDKRTFPSFFRTVPSDVYQSHGLARLVLHFGWTWVGLLALDNDYGQQGIQQVRQEIIQAGACVAFSENILMSQPNRNAPHIVQVIKESTAKVIVAFSNAIDLVPLFDEMLSQNVTGRVLVASESWSTSALFSMGKYSRLLSGTIGLSLLRGSISGFKEFLNRIHPFVSPGRHWVKLFWEQAFNCKFSDQNNLTDYVGNSVKQCTGSENMESIQNSYTDISSLRESCYIYTAVHVVANALALLKNCNNENSPFLHKQCPNMWNFKPWQLLHYVKKVRVMQSNRREHYFDKNGDPPAAYDIVNWQLSSSGTIKHVKVGSFDTGAPLGQDFIINASAMLWATGDKQVPLSVCSPSCPPGFRKAAIRGKPVCCFQCVPCPIGDISNHTDAVDCMKCPPEKWADLQKSKCLPKTIEYLAYEDPLGATLAAFSLMSSLIPVAILRLFIQYKTTPIVKANNYSLSCILLMSIFLCFLCSFAFIGYPNHEKCLLRQIAFGLVFAICISCILAKTIIVVFAFMATKPGSSLKKWTSPRLSYVVILICTLLQLILCVSWMSICPSFPEQKTHIQSGIIIIECNEGSPTAFWCMLGYLVLLATISFILAFLSRRLPDSFNEAKFITFSMLAFLSVWVSFVPASLSASGKYTVAMEIFAILASSWAMLICMFLPKCFIILLRPNMNSREYLMRKDRVNSDKIKTIYT